MLACYSGSLTTLTDNTMQDPSRSEYLSLHQRHYHVRHWGPEHAPKLLLLHGWMDCAASFQFMVAALQTPFHIIAPDWRGFGNSEANQGSYYSPDYLADLDVLCEHFSPKEPVLLAGHSMGAMVAGLYAGIRPERIRKLALIEGFGLPDCRPEEAPGRYARWLRELREPPAFAPIQSLATVAQKLIERSPRLTPARAEWLAAQLTGTDAETGGLVYRADARHKMVNPVLYRLAEAQACWQRISCPVLWIMAGDQWDHPMAKAVADSMEIRRAAFQQRQEVIIHDSGHMIQWEQPERLAAVLDDFF